MTELNPNIILQAGAFKPLDPAAILEQRAQVQLRNLGIQRQQQQDQLAQAQMQRENEARARAAQAGQLASSGDVAGADRLALEAGDFDLHGHIAGLQKEHRDQIAAKIATAAPIAFQLKNVPYEQRKAAIMANAEQLTAAGWKPEELAQFDPTDQNLDQLVASSQTIDASLARFDKNHAPYTMSEGDSRFDANNNLVAQVPKAHKFQAIESANGYVNYDPDTGTYTPLMGVGGQPSSSAPASGSGNYAPPPSNLIRTATGGHGSISSNFGPRAAPSPGASTFHNGVDVALPAGSPVAAAANGTVIAAWNDTAHGGGLSVRIRHPDGSITGYADLGSYSVKVGDTVHAGQPIGVAGSSGSTSTGNHLHLSYRAPGAAPATNGQQLQGKPHEAPTGYRWNGTKLEPIPGGPAEHTLIPQGALTLMADQYLSGDRSVLQNLGRGTQGQNNIVLLRSEIYNQAMQRGMKGADIARVMAQFNGMMAEARTVGNIGGKVDYGSNELTQAIPLAQRASEAVPRGQFVPVTRIQQMIQAGTSSPALKDFAVKTNAVINAYNLVAARSGTSTAEREHNATLLRTADSPEAYQAALAAMGMEADVARNASRTTMDNIGGGAGNIPTMTPEQARNAPKGTRFRTTDGRVMVRQ